MFRHLGRILVVPLGILAGFSVACGNLGSKGASSSMVSSETVVGSGGEVPPEPVAAANAPTPPMVPVSDVESLVEWAFAYKFRASYGLGFEISLDPNRPERLLFQAGDPALVRLLPQWIHLDKEGHDYGSWYSTLDGTILRYVWTPPGEDPGGAEACDLVLERTGGPIGTEAHSLVGSPFLPVGTEVRLPLAAGRLKVYAYDPLWETAPAEMVAPVPAVPSCAEGLGPLSVEDFEKFRSRRFVNTGESSVFHLASFDLAPTVEARLPSKSLSTIPLR